MFILDTDHVSLFQRNHPHVSARLLATPSLELATTVVTVEDQIVRAYHNLLATVLYFRTITIIGFDQQAQVVFKSLFAQKIRTGTHDLRIAAIALRYGATLVTRNRQDFAAIPSLKMEDWSWP
jgi:tRNA(fMet)-specific endonuclease VapC